LNLTRFWTKLRVLVLCFPDFTENFNVSALGFFQILWRKSLLVFCFHYRKGLKSSVTTASSQLSILIGGVWGATHSFGSS
jgi:hypothetical protein